MNRLTANETNNFVYLLIKYGFRKLVPALANPPNDLIQEVLLEVANKGANIPNVIDCTLRVVDRRHNPWISDRDFERLKAYCYQLSVAFLRLPEELRNDLGKDRAFFDLPTFH